MGSLQIKGCEDAFLLVFSTSLLINHGRGGASGGVGRRVFVTHGGNPRVKDPNVPASKTWTGRVGSLSSWEALYRAKSRVV